MRENLISGIIAVLIFLFLLAAGMGIFAVCNKTFGNLQEQVTNIKSGITAATDPAKPGTLTEEVGRCE